METTYLKILQSKRLLFFGVLLFFLGLLVGMFIPMMANPRMGLSSHLEGVMNGLFLLSLGLIWNQLALSQKWLSVTFWLTLYGSFANFLAVLIAAITGSGKMMPLAGGKQGHDMEESIISFLLISLSFAMLTVCVVVLIGLYRHLNLKD